MQLKSVMHANVHKVTVNKDNIFVCYLDQTQGGSV